MEEYFKPFVELTRTLRQAFSYPTTTYIFSTVVIIVYLVRNRKRYGDKEKAREVLIGCAFVAISSLAVFPGLSVFLLCFDQPTCDAIKIDPRAFFAGGVVLLLVGVHGMLSNFKQ